MSPPRRIAIAVWLSILGIADIGLASEPAVPFAGRVLTPAGMPYNGFLDLNATLLNSANASIPTWGPHIFTNITVEDGDFTVLLDHPDDPIADALEGLDEAWLEFSIRPDGEDWILLDGRQRIFALPFVHAVDNAEALGGGGSSDFLATTTAEATLVGRDALSPLALSGTDDDLQSRPNLSGYAIVANLAGVCFSGSYSDLVDEPTFSAFVTADALAGVATSGAYGDLGSTPDLAAFVPTTALHQVASNGSYSDLAGRPDLSLYATTGGLAVVATTGAYGDLLGAVDTSSVLSTSGSQTMRGQLDLGGNAIINAVVHALDAEPADPAPGQLWFDTRSEVLMVFTTEGWQAVGVQAGADQLAAATGGLMGTTFSETKSASIALPTTIPDASQAGATATVEVVESGTLASFNVVVGITHPAPPELRVTLTAPSGQQFTLHDGGAGSDSGIVGTWPPLATVDGDLGSLLGSNPTGTWTLTATDTTAGNTGTIDRFELNYEVTRDGELLVQGDEVVSGEVNTTGAVVGGVDVAARLAALQGDIWCTKNCDASSFDGCKERVCDGVAKTCVDGNPVADGWPCDDKDVTTVGDSCAGGVCAGVRPHSCIEIRALAPSSRDGLYWLWPDGSAVVHAYCDMTYDGGGWTLVQSYVANDDAAESTTVDQGAGTYLPSSVVQPLANGSTMVRITERETANFIVSIDSYPIERLRSLLMLTDSSARQPGGAGDENLQHWSGNKTSQLYVGYCPDMYDAQYPIIYWACGTGGIHITPGSSDTNYPHGWTNTDRLSMDVWVR